jgi:4,5-dihydroxyphthalate decarboxylase
MTLSLSLACQNTDRTRAILDGRVGVEGCRLDIVTAPAEEIFQRAFRHREFDISELSLSSHLITTARGEGAYVAVPAFVSRAFRHASIYVRGDRDIEVPADLRGRRVGVPDFQQTAGVWVRGILADEYGVERHEIEWLTGGLERAGRSTRVPLSLPRNLSVTPIGPTETLSSLLADGAIDAVIAPRPPSCFGRSRHVRRLFRDSRSTETGYFEKTGLFPLMHTIGIRRELVERHPWLPVNVYSAFRQALSLAVAELRALDTVKVTHPWIADEVERIVHLMGEDYWRYGIDKNRKELEAMIRYAQADGLIARPVALNELFAATTFDEFNF